MNRDICCCVFELLFVPSAEYLERCVFSLICRFFVSVWPVVGQYVPRTGKNLSREYLGLIILVVIFVFSCINCGCWFLITFSFVSVIPVGLSDLLAGSWNRTW